MTNQELLAKLNISSNLFLGVDETTISRWMNNKTTPSFKRQFHILFLLNMSIEEILESIELPDETNNFSSSLKKMFIESEGYNSLSYIPSIDIEDDTTIITNNTDSDTKKYITKYYDNFDFYSDLKLEEILNNDNTKYLSILKNNHYIPNSHLCYTILDASYINEKINLKMNSGDVFLHISYFSGFDCFKYLIALFITDLLSLNDLDITIYSIARSDGFKSIHNKVNSELLYKSPKNSKNNKDYFIIYKTRLFNIIEDHNTWHLLKLIH